MKSFRINSILLTIIGVLTFVCSVSAVVAAEKNDMKGWGKNDPYNKYYNSKELDSLKGKVKKFKSVTPLSGMAPATAFWLGEGDDDVTLVHLCPEWFATSKQTGIRKGDKVKVKGAWAEINGKDIFIASKVKKDNDFEFKVRLTKDGTPFWTMSKEELAKERRQH